jgi:hypothetical protein
MYFDGDSAADLMELMSSLPHLEQVAFLHILEMMTAECPEDILDDEEDVMTIRS